MTTEYYKNIIVKQNNIETGIAMGRAIKDNQINPETYASLCRQAISMGFKFQFIVFSD